MAGSPRACFTAGGCFRDQPTIDIERKGWLVAVEWNPSVTTRPHLRAAGDFMTRKQPADTFFVFATGSQDVASANSRSSETTVGKTTVAGSPQPRMGRWST